VVAAATEGEAVEIAAAEEAAPVQATAVTEDNNGNWQPPVVG